MSDTDRLTAEVVVLHQQIADLTARNELLVLEYNKLLHMYEEAQNDLAKAARFFGDINRKLDIALADLHADVLQHGSPND